jgi:glucose-6-phosphate-specific signal transduction histidine kinase
MNNRYGAKMDRQTPTSKIGILLLFIALGLSAQPNSNELTNFPDSFRLKYSELNQKEINKKANIEISIELQEIINEMLADLPENENKGLGLKSMESRINYINGTMELNSVIGEGTTMTISIPSQT